MAEHATERTLIHAPPRRCFEVAIDFERYPDWATDIKEARVVTRDEHGRGVDVAFRAAAMGRSTSYTLRYDYANAPDRLAWQLVDGDVTRRLDGEYQFEASPETEGATEVTYHLLVELVVPLPGFVKRRAEAKILKAALPDLKARVESLG